MRAQKVAPQRRIATSEDIEFLTALIASVQSCYEHNNALLGEMYPHLNDRGDAEDEVSADAINAWMLEIMTTNLRVAESACDAFASRYAIDTPRLAPAQSGLVLRAIIRFRNAVTRNDVWRMRFCTHYARRDRGFIDETVLDVLLDIQWTLRCRGGVPTRGTIASVGSALTTSRRAFLARRKRVLQLRQQEG